MEKLKKTASVIETLLKIALVGVILMGVVNAGMAIFVLTAQGAEGSPVNVVAAGGLQFLLNQDIMVNAGPVMIATLINAVLSCLISVYLIRQLQLVFRPMSQGNIFPQGVGKRIRNIAFAELAIGLVHTISGGAVAAAQFQSFGMDQLFLNGNIKSVQLMVDMDMGFVWVFALLLLLSGIFRYGEELQAANRK